MDLGYGEMWESFEKQAIEEGWDSKKIFSISDSISKGINAEIEELAELGVLKR